MYAFPLVSTLIPNGVESVAFVAAPLSPQKPCVPVPAIVVMTQLSGYKSNRIN